MFAPEHKSKSKTQSEAKSASKNRTSDDIKPIPIKSLFSPLAAQLKPAIDNNELTPIPKTNEAQENLRPKVNNTGIPTLMKSRFEALSGFSFDDVKVHYNSDKPAQLQALAYTKGNQVHIAPGQEKHLGHELGHVVQQKQGIVKPTMQLHGLNINDNAILEKDADNLGNKEVDNTVVVKSVEKDGLLIQRMGRNWVAYSDYNYSAHYLDPRDTAHSQAMAILEKAITDGAVKPKNIYRDHRKNDKTDMMIQYGCSQAGYPFLLVHTNAVYDKGLLIFDTAYLSSKGLGTVLKTQHCKISSITLSE